MGVLRRRRIRLQLSSDNKVGHTVFASSSRQYPLLAPEGNGHGSGQAPLPSWATQGGESTTPKTEEPPADTGNGGLQRLKSLPKVDGGSIFAIPTGPSPEEIPGFPTPPVDYSEPAQPAYPTAPN